MFDRIKTILFGNFLIKAFSLLFAALLWFHVVARGKSEVNFVVPLELRDIPAGMVVVGDVPGYVDVRMQGPEAIIRNLAPGDVSVALSIADAREGAAQFYLGPSNVKAPGNITVTTVSPVEIRIRLDESGEKTLPVTAVLSGNPAPGYMLGKVEVTPGTVSVKGPKSVLGRLKGLDTQPLEMTGVTGKVSEVVPLEPPTIRGVRLSQDEVLVEAEVVKVDR
ncbi:MAG: hypothetical protein HZC51_09285 [Nitrospirae bacterium]|nr:hypothetical protein [Nitrospirota bacterium]